MGLLREILSVLLIVASLLVCAMRSALGSPDKFLMRETIMKIFNCRLVQKYAILALVLCKLAKAVLELLSMAFNYLPKPFLHDNSRPMVIKI